MAHVELPKEELQPLIESMKMVFEPFLNVMPDIAKIPSEVERLVKVISQDVKSGQGARFEDGSKKSVDMIQMMKDFNEKNTPEGKKRAEELAKLERIAQERQKAEADLQQLQQIGTPAEITEDNKVKILNEKEIIEKQKEYIKEQKEVTFLEKQIEEEKGKGEDADSERLLILKEALDKQNQLLEEQGQVLGDRLPRQKYKEEEGLGARDFIPDPLMEVFDTVGPELITVKDSLLSFAKPFTGTFKFLGSLFKKRADEEEEYIDELQERKEGEKKTGKESAKTALKLVGLTLAVAGAIAAMVALAKAIYKIPGVKYLAQDDNLQRERGLVFQESNQEYFDRLVDKEGKTPDEARKIVDSDVFNFLGNMTDTAPMDLRHSSELGPEGTGKKSFLEGATYDPTKGKIIMQTPQGDDTKSNNTVIIKKDGDNNNFAVDNSASKGSNRGVIEVNAAGYL